MAEKLTRTQFAQRIRERHPGAYDDIPDDALADRVLTKHPEYGDMINETPGMPSLAERVWDWSNKGVVSGDTLVRAMTGKTRDQIDAGQKQIVSDGIKDSGGFFDPEWWKAYGENFAYGATKDTADTASSFTSPLSIGLMATGGLGTAAKAANTAAKAGKTLNAAQKAVRAVGPLTKAVSAGAGVGFGARGAGQVDEAIEDDSRPLADRIQQGLTGAAMVAGGAAGVKDPIEGGARRAGELTAHVTRQAAERAKAIPQTLEKLEISPDMKAKAGAIAPLVANHVASKIPIASWFARKPSLVDYVDAARTKAPVEPSPAQPVPPASTDVVPSPYRLSGKQLVDAATVTPTRPFEPKALLPEVSEGTALGRRLEALRAEAPAAPAELEPVPFKGKTPLAQQVEVFKKMGIAAPSASVKPMAEMPGAVLEPRADLRFGGARNGESAALSQLTRYGINELRAIAVQRGLKIKPADSHAAIIQKLMDNLTEAEIAEFGAQAMERNRFPREMVERDASPRVPTDDADLANLLQQSVMKAKRGKGSLRARLSAN